VGIILQLGQATTGEVGVWHMCNGNDWGRKGSGATDKDKRS
jgi:hypothetical protein